MKASCIVLCTLNDRFVTERLLPSLRAHSDLADTEIIVVDNNSADRTNAVARQHGVTVVAEPVNNIAKARNSGARAARGKYLAFCDADNQVTDNLLVLIHDQLEDPRVAGGGTWKIGRAHV